MKQFHIEVKPDNEISPTERSVIWDHFVQIFMEDAAEMEWSQVDWHVLVWEANALVNHVEIVERTATVDGQPVKLGGIGGVATLPAWRGQGLATAAMREAARFMCRELRVDFGLLICGQEMTPFYSRLGWQIVQGPLVFEQPGGKVTFDGVVMVLPCQGEAWPAGVIDLCGLPW